MQGYFPGKLLVVIPASKNPDLVQQNLVDEPVLLVDAAGPASGQLMLQWFRLTDSRKRVALYVSTSRMMRIA